ncbi:MAG: hypothetical protein PF487_14015 [Bacteroidales bacterium]|jgi:hypothetical protein|nr:hypothetical protein [Bacteroidales bacterium]
MKKWKKEKMEKVSGGVSKAEYCATAKKILQKNAVDSVTAGYVAYLCQGEW